MKSIKLTGKEKKNIIFKKETCNAKRYLPLAYA